MGWERNECGTNTSILGGHTCHGCQIVVAFVVKTIDERRPFKHLRRTDIWAAYAMTVSVEASTVGIFVAINLPIRNWLFFGHSEKGRFDMCTICSFESLLI